MRTDTHSSADLVSLRTAHLGMIQGVIARMSGFSATAKNFAVTTALALVAIAFDKGAPLLIWAGIFSLIAFGAMDFYYHVLELRFRELYQTTAQRPLEPPSDLMLDAPTARLDHVAKVMRSVIFFPFYVLLLFGMIGALYVAGHAETAQHEIVTSAVSNAGGPARQTAPQKRVGGTSAKKPSPAATERADRAAGNAASDAKG